MWGTKYFRTLNSLSTSNLFSRSVRDSKTQKLVSFAIQSNTLPCLFVSIAKLSSLNKVVITDWFPLRLSIFLRGTVSLSFLMSIKILQLAAPSCCVVFFYFMLCYTAVEGTSWGRAVAPWFCRNLWKCNCCGIMWLGLPVRICRGQLLCMS